ncbi:multifunctional 2',3'-cyclic-nucleotide 2'-phosphodiesterase/5'-nucleotidase/3'-nucleotidase [Nocardioides sp. Soil774]|uniref:bifunctional metallophosphatase/5'-nucleotidase n=1 Tax=Nocardioides sp. Soil774 TaxID=1736408 RepID=UPI0006F81354|nr:5'-nucleotidase C-terminal domain-containing protein [Nocardioides sp. Soil774]KRE96332.1 multifunctional 2',3'-cyclic-nucleotide 2'-phosphodiesterase/5'-nucleotidase/3'-nucleotidase [Nocardioides sp. Soil774]
MTSQHTPSRRTVVTGAAALTAAGFVATAAPASARPGALRTRVTVLGTTDLHGNVLNWDYFKNLEFDNSKHDDIGIAKAATLIKAVREQLGTQPVLTLDAGDTIQGTPLAYYYARIDPITGGSTHPMANAMNLVGYDAAALGNHEFNYGIDTLRTFESQLDFPLLGANAVDPATGRPVFPPYVIKRFKVHGAPDLTVGVLGLTNPGIAIWDKANVEGRMEFPGLVEQASKFVPELKRRGCDVVVISAHSGADTSSSYGDALPWPENAASLVAEQVPDVDAILVGHAHKDIPARYVTNAETGHEVLLTEPAYWGMRVAVMDLDVELDRGRWRVTRSKGQLLNSNTVSGDPAVLAAVREQHDTVVAYVNSVIGTSTTALSADRAVVEDVPIIDFVQYVQAGAVKAALSGADASLPVLSIAAPFNRGASFPAGEVTVRDVAGLYIYDNTLLGVKVTGAQVKDYLEYSARYFQQVSGTGPFTVEQVTRAVTPTAPNGTPDYNFDTVAGLDAPLTYEIDISQPVGSRIVGLAYDGVPVAPGQEFAMAVNNYRQSGGGGFPHVSTAPVVYNRQDEIRQLIIDWVTAHGVIDPAAFASVDWRLVSGGQPVQIS